MAIAPQPDTTFNARIVAEFGDIDAEAWDACAGSNNPFVSHAFLSALEDSGSATADTGWLGQHLLIEDENDVLVAAAPNYLKSHSQGEYVFDHAWADAYQRAGGRYYPKLQGSVPFTPATGPRLLTLPGPNAPEMKRRLGITAATLAERLQVSSAHFTFLEEADAAVLEEIGYLTRWDTQYHWENADYATFDDFLDTLTSRKRKTIRRERREALPAGIDVEILSGSDLSEDHWDHFFGFYQETGRRKWGQPYLTRRFFSLVAERMADQIVLVMARRDGQYIAGALNFLGADTLYGRYWGATEHHRFLHFELSYYQAIDIAIERGLKWVEAGAQGEHKIARGYVPTKTRSAHYIHDAGFRDAVAQFLIRERRAVEDQGEYLKDFGPFKRGDSE